MASKVGMALLLLLMLFGCILPGVTPQPTLGSLTLEECAECIDSLPECCVEDCCGPGTSWDGIKSCRADATSEGFNGTYSSEYKLGCVPRECCEADCCMDGETEYDVTIGCCVPVEDELDDIIPSSAPSLSAIPTKSSAPSNSEKPTSILSEPPKKQVKVWIIPINGVPLIKFEHEVPPGKQFGLEFIPKECESDVKEFNWRKRFQGDNVNNPEFKYTHPKEKETGVENYHWYGHGDVGDDIFEGPPGGEDDDSLRWIGNTMKFCSYELLCDVTFNDGTVVTAAIKPGAGVYRGRRFGKYFFVGVDDSGKTARPCLSGYSDLQFEYNEAKKYWFITGKGQLSRVPAEIIKLPDRNSQFAPKKLVHQDSHRTEYEFKFLGKPVLFDPDEFLIDVILFTSPFKITLKIRLIIHYWRTFRCAMYDREIAVIGTEAEQALRNYKEEYDVRPVKVRERSEKWIRANHPRRRPLGC